MATCGSPLRNSHPGAHERLRLARFRRRNRAVSRFSGGVITFMWDAKVLCVRGSKSGLPRVPTFGAETLSYMRRVPVKGTLR